MDCLAPSVHALLLLLLCLACSSAQPGQEYLAGHNAARAEVRVAPLVWDAAVAAFAKGYANTESAANACRLLKPSGGPYGENKFWGSGGSKQWTAADAVASWVQLKQFYNASTNTCSRADQQCGVYTQVVWRASTALGCASSTCPDNSTFIICNYQPAGNVVGQRPF